MLAVLVAVSLKISKIKFNFLNSSNVKSFQKLTTDIDAFDIARKTECLTLAASLCDHFYKSYFS